MTTAAPAGLVDGERRRDAALALLADRRAVLVRLVQRAYLRLLLDGGPSTTDPVRATVPTPPDIDPRFVGAAVRALAGLRIIHQCGRTRSTRPAAHARDLPVWAIQDRAAAVAWLAAHPELSPVDDDDDDPAQPTLYDV